MGPTSPKTIPPFPKPTKIVTSQRPERYASPEQPVLRGGQADPVKAAPYCTEYSERSIFWVFGRDNSYGPQRIQAL